MMKNDSRFETPVDCLTNQPLPIYFTEEEYEAAGDEVRGHHPAHDRYRPELKDPAGKLARRTRIYMTPNILHMGIYPSNQYNTGSYHNVFKGPYIPDESKTKIQIAVLNLSQVIPRKALELDRMGGYQERELSDDQHNFYSNRSITRIENQHRNSLKAWYSRTNLGHAIINYALEQGINDLISNTEANKFLKTKEFSVIRSIGDLVMYRAVDEIVKPAVSTFKIAQSEGMVAPDSPSPVEAVNKYLPHHQLRQHYERIEEILKVERDRSAGFIALQTELGELAAA